MRTVCEKDMCAGCNACLEICKNKAIKLDKSLNAYNAIIDESKCINCNRCFKVCPNNSSVEYNKTISIVQGWTSDKDIRENASSGGVATALATQFINEKGVVWSCTFKSGEFVFCEAKNIDDLKLFAGSKYVKSDPKGIYNQIKQQLMAGLNVMFIGLPCQIAALLNYVGTRWAEKLITVDLICHGTPSPQVLDVFLQQYELNIEEIKDIRFRKKTHFQVYGMTVAETSYTYKGIEKDGCTDEYMIAFLNGLTYTENCYHCQYARKERISDITLGDSWGSELSITEQKKGISLILCQTEKGKKLVESANLILMDVDEIKAYNSNKQLNSPMRKPKNRDDFFLKLKKGKKFNKLVRRYYTKQCVRQKAKKMLLIMGLLGK